MVSGVAFIPLYAEDLPGSPPAPSSPAPVSPTPPPSVAPSEINPVLPADPNDVLAPPSRKKVAVFQAMVSLDGVERPDLGKWFADTLSAGFLKSGQFDVIDAERHAGLADATPGVPLGPVEAGRVATVDCVYVPVVIGQGSVYKVTVRKLLIPSGKLESVFENTSRDPSVPLFDVIDRVVAEIAPKPVPVVKPSPIKAVKAWFSGPSDVAEALAAAPKAVRLGSQQPTLGMSRSSSATAEKKPSKPSAKTTAKANSTPPEPTEREIEEVGTVSVANDHYSFCVIRPSDGRTLKPGDRVMIAVSGWHRPTLEATVTRIERGHAVAEFKIADGESQVTVADGARVYDWLPNRWAPPAPFVMPEPTQGAY